MESRQQQEVIELTINGQQIRVPAFMPDPVTGEPVPITIMRACELAGVYVPHYCYHPGLRVAGNCRMCLVECSLPVLGPDRQPIRDEQGRPVTRPLGRPVIACATPVTPYMEVHTETETVKRMRAEVLEFLLLNHPLDCPICDQAGECVLQEYSYEYGHSRSRSRETKVHKPKAQRIGPHVVLDAERCILCTRCIRFMRDVVGDDCLGIINRGVYSTLTIYPGRQLNSNYSLNTVDLCPVGALTSADFRFRMRVWFLKETESICAGCARGCNVIVGSRENKIYRLTPRYNPSVNGYWMCDFGRFTYRIVEHPNRIRRPVSRVSNSHDLDRIMDEVANRLLASPPGTVAIIASASLSCEELFLIKKLADHLNAWTDCVPHYGEPDHLLLVEDRNANTNGARLTGVCFTEIGIQLPYIAEGIDRGRIQTVLCVGEDLSADEAFEEEVLNRIPFLAVSAFEPNGTTALAHVVLPACSHFEKEGTFINEDGRLQRFHRAITPPPDVQPELVWLSKLLEKVTGHPVPRNARLIFESMCREIQQIPVRRWDEVGPQGVVVPNIA